MSFEVVQNGSKGLTRPSLSNRGERMSESTAPELSWLEALPLLTATQRREVVSVFRRALVESPLPTVLTRTGDGRILGCNRQFEEMLGIDEPAIHTQRIAELVH